MCSFKFETVVLIKVGDALLQSQSLKGTIGPKNSATFVRLLLSIFASLLVCFPSTALVLGNWPRSKNDYWQAIITLVPLFCFVSIPPCSCQLKKTNPISAQFFSHAGWIRTFAYHRHLYGVSRSCIHNTSKAQRQTWEFLLINLLACKDKEKSKCAKYFTTNSNVVLSTGKSTGR